MSELAVITEGKRHVVVDGLGKKLAWFDCNEDAWRYVDKHSDEHLSPSTKKADFHWRRSFNK